VYPPLGSGSFVMLYGCGMVSALKIVLGVVVYRLRKLEMANLAAAASIAAALHLPLLDIAFRTMFAFFLNALVYLNNDYVDIELDLNSADKDAQKSRYLKDNLRSALWAQWVMLGMLVVAAVVYDIGMLVPLVTGGGICVWYSAVLKRRPYVDILAMMGWGVAMPLCGSPVESVLGWCLALQLGLFSGVFETIQVMRDSDEDAAEGVRTTSVVLGKERTLWLARGLMVLSSVYALLVLHPIAGAISVVALLLPFRPDRVESYWTRVKLTYGIAWLAICAFVYFAGHGEGLLLSLDRAASFG
jgi:4-hydroxybenzoate polyprenyltransferase